MRAFLIVFVLFGAAALLNAADEGESWTYGKCIRKYLGKEVKPQSATMEQIDCMYICFMQSVKWLKYDGAFNEKSLEGQTNEKKKEVMEVVNSCHEKVKGDYTSCKFAGCLRRHHIASFYS